jgi:alkanesulfonate monooxygenase SsuD/methylene tetrahydromethanopterin reductase-like flavin-dependent oxidoreductase (luciferase family)
MSELGAEGVQFCYFTPIPWPRQVKRPDEWPFPNESFDPKFAHVYYRSQIEQLVYAEDCGFDWVATGEDHMTAYSLTPSPALIISIAAYLTTKVKLAILGLPLPLLNPIRVAEECAMLDVISGGRFIAGFIRGVPQNYAAYNVDPDESRGRFEEARQLIIKAWTSPEIFSWNGTFYKYPKVSLWPVPLQKPYPRIVFSANSTKSAIDGAKAKATIGAIHLYNRNALDLVEGAIDAYRRHAESDGWQTSPQCFLIGLQTCIAKTDTEAEMLLGPALDYQFNVLSGTYNAQKREIARAKPGYGLSPVEENPPSLMERLSTGIVLCGSPATVIEQIEHLIKRLGVGTISMHFQVGNMTQEAVLEGMRLFHDKVLPRFRSSRK